MIKTVIHIAAAILLLHAAQGQPTQVLNFAKQHVGSAAGVITFTGNGTGQESKTAGLDAYVAQPKLKSSPTSAVLIFTDIYGYKLDAVRVWADNLAAQGGYLVVIPDFFKGTPRTKDDPSSTLPTWLEKYPREQVLKEAADVFAAIRKQYSTAKTVGAVGFCWGGLYATLVTTGRNPLVAASVVYHGSLLKPEDIQAINAPITFQQSDPALDTQINTTFYKQIQGILATKQEAGQDVSITYYPGQPHGYSLRGGSDPNVTAVATTAFKAGLAFLKKYLE